MPGVLRRVGVALGAGLLAAVPLASAQAYYYPYPYYGYGYGYGYGYVPRPVYEAPVAPPAYYYPRYAVPPASVAPSYGRYGRIEPRRVRRVPVRSLSRPRLVPATASSAGPSTPSPFAGPGLDGVVPASSGLSPFTLAPAPATPPQPASVAPTPAPAGSTPPRNSYPPESFAPSRGD